MLKQLRWVFQVPNHFHVDPNIVWKRCGKTIVKLMKINAETRQTYLLDAPDTITNEHRKSLVNPKWAKHRGFPLYCDLLYSVHKNEFFDHKLHFFVGPYGCRKEILYEGEKVIYPDAYANDPEVVCGPGLHFFQTLEAAALYDPGIAAIKFIDPKRQYVVLLENGDVGYEGVKPPQTFTAYLTENWSSVCV